MAALHWCRKLTGNEDTSPQVCVCPPVPSVGRAGGTWGMLSLDCTCCQAHAPGAVGFRLWRKPSCLKYVGLFREKLSF